LRYNGVCYDVGRVMMGQNWRPAFDAAEVDRELAIIKDDLHCNAVRICGQDLDRLTTAAGLAMDRGLAVWFCPELWDRAEAETLAYIDEAARRAQQVRQGRAGQLVLSVGSELTLFMQGIVDGESVLARLQHPTFWDRIRSGAHNIRLNAFLAEANAVARRSFKGAVTYASVPLEDVAWDLFDVVCADLYRDVRIRDQFPSLLQRFTGLGRPVVITEFGCCTYRGAADAGGTGWAIVNPDVTPPRWNGVYVRDEGEQAHEISEVLTILGDAGIDGAFVMTFISPLLLTSGDPRYDLDMASYSLVKSYRDRCGDRYRGLPWDPKESFAAVASYYAAHQGGR